jgi:hypothetical protein
MLLLDLLILPINFHLTLILPLLIPLNHIFVPIRILIPIHIIVPLVAHIHILILLIIIHILILIRYLIPYFHIDFILVLILTDHFNINFRHCIHLFTHFYCLVKILFLDHLRYLKEAKPTQSCPLKINLNYLIHHTQIICLFLHCYLFI